MSQENSDPTPRWRERVAALKNIPPVLGMVWEAAPKVIVSSLACRVLTALLPLAVLEGTSVSINDIVIFRAHPKALPPIFWWLVGLEFVLASLGAILARAIIFLDIVLADKYS